MFSQNTTDALQERIDAGDTHLVATHAVITVFTTYTKSWLGDRDTGRKPLDSVEDAAFVLAFVMYWRSHVTRPGSSLTLAANFLTRETFLDIVTSSCECSAGCSACVLCVVALLVCIVWLLCWCAMSGCCDVCPPCSHHRSQMHSSLQPIS
eukprot:1963756-Prymnesium_polylepis.1